MGSQSHPMSIASVVNISQSARVESHLTTIPLEVLLQITSRLVTPDYGNFRLACKKIEQRLHNAFSQEFFTKRQFMLTHFSLRALIEISESRFSGSLTNVILGLERPSLQEMNHSSDRLTMEYADHVTLLQSGHHIEMLSAAFSNLRNLKTVGFRDFNSRSRWRDFPKHEWRSYGCQTFEQDTQNRLQVLHKSDVTAGIMSLDKSNYLSLVFLSILCAIGKSSSQPHNLEVILRNVSLFDHCFNLPSYLLHTLQPKLEHIRTLFLDLNSLFPSMKIDENRSSAVPSFYLRKFLTQTPNLEHLRLNFDQYSRAHDSNGLLSWLASPVIAPVAILEIPPAISLCKLNRLDLGMVELPRRLMLDLIAKFGATLKTLSLHKVCMKCDWKVPKGVNLWERFFTDLSDMDDVELTAINMSFLTHNQFHGSLARTKSPPLTFEDSREEHTKRWAGKHMKTALRDFASRAVVRWFPEEKTSEGAAAADTQDSSDEDHDEEDDEEDD